MKANNEVAPKGVWAKFMHWYESYTGKKVVGCVYSLGASIVIVGALFKIMHFPGAGIMLTVGMGIEALLFAIGCLDKPHAEFHWENVFPQLMSFGADPKLIKELETRPCPTLLGGAAGGSESTASTPALSEKELAALKASLDNLTKTATQLSELSTLATATNKLTEKLGAAEQAAEQFVEAGKVIGEKSNELGNAYTQVTADVKKIATDTKEYESQVSAISSQLSSLNAMYEMQLKAMQSQAEAYKQQAEKIAKTNEQVDQLINGVKSMTTTAAEAVKNQEAYVAGAKQLASQVADLNKVYGNMLSALS